MTLLITLVLPAALICIATGFRIITGEDAIQVLGIAIILTNQGGSIRIIHHILVEVAAIFEQVTNNRAQENDIASGACRNIEICQRRSTREVGVYMDNLCPTLLRFDDIRESHRMGLCHIAAHNQNSIAIHQVLRKCRGTATSQRGTQTGYGRAVSYTGLVLD